ncbi:hypothetical protein PN467_13975 [Microcystis aeruginosa CS-563/04]|jgi:hypothetical protein|uniref:hypothetical protein n=1 Tax=Microcystis aeruginosa TaxID=1126 RepID=UPI00232CCA12|nr:hypothetical protein [Microcystis aeruginosa]MDB9421595.1 hypothetical protein [Microcystis aeruginosa CS-563/04]
MRSLKKCLSLALITLALLLAFPLWGHEIPQKEKPKFVDILEVVVQVLKLFEDE